MQLPRQCQDARSLALLRVLLGLYVIYDVLSRLKHGRVSLLWFTSSDGSFLREEDSPHGNVLHRLWFYRGTELLQWNCFSATLLLALLYAFGYRCRTTNVALWFWVVAMQSRNMHMHDGSDTFLRHLLLWSCQLPMARFWSVDAFRGRNASQKQNLVDSTTISSAAVWGIRLQIVFMYLGTVLNRTLDKFGVSGLHHSEWMPPQLTAVHYALSSSFAVRDVLWGDMVRQNIMMSQFMTVCSMLIESLAPCLLLVLPSRYHTLPASLLFQLHLGLLLFVNLPNWQFIGMLASVIWIPGHVWDGLLRQLSKQFPHQVPPPPVKAPTKKNDDGGEKPPHGRANVPGRRRPFLTYFLLAYMIYNWCSERRWIPKFDNGDIGEFLRFSQFWVMYGRPPRNAVNTIFVGQQLNGTSYYDVWHWIASPHELALVNYDQRTSSIWVNMTHVYPSPRWERIFDQWGGRNDISRATYFLQQFCKIPDQPFERLEIIWQHLRVMPPGSSKRYEKFRQDVTVHALCE